MRGEALSVEPKTAERVVISASPEETFALGAELGRAMKGGEIVLMTGGLGAGKTLMTKGILHALGLETDEVTSPSFALVNLYQAKFPVYHIDLWRIGDAADAAAEVGLDEILEDESAVVIIEWAEKLKRLEHPVKAISVSIEGDGDESRKIEIREM